MARFPIQSLLEQNLHIGLVANSLFGGEHASALNIFSRDADRNILRLAPGRFAPRSDQCFRPSAMGRSISDGSDQIPACRRRVTVPPLCFLGLGGKLGYDRFFHSLIPLPFRYAVRSDFVASRAVTTRTVSSSRIVQTTSKTRNASVWPRDIQRSSPLTTS